ncbi:MAG: DUF1700 domain-containing protein [Peptococcaceae bacterium]|nr:DUF1700 domain-containing protein [Peptococcaceae bacterium]
MTKDYERAPMNKDTYLKELSHYLRKLPKEDYDNAMAYFTEYFEEAGPENEASVIAELGTPKEAAAELLRNLMAEGSHPKAGKKSSSFPHLLSMGLMVVLLSPLSLLGLLLLFVGVVVGLSLIFAVVVTIGTTEFALILGGGYSIYLAIGLLASNFSAALISAGAGLIAIGLAVLFLLLAYHLCRAILAGILWLINTISSKRSV